MFNEGTLQGCNEPFVGLVGKVAGFSLHAGVAAKRNGASDRFEHSAQLASEHSEWPVVAHFCLTMLRRSASGAMLFQSSQRGFRLVPIRDGRRVRKSMTR